MGIDLEKSKRGRRKLTCRRKPRSPNVYLHLAHQLYTFLARRTDSKFNRTVSKRLAMSRQHRPPVSLQRVALTQARNPERIIAVVGNITDDQRILDLPKITLCALHVTERARRRVLQSGGEILSFDQLALRAPLGQNVLLLRGKLMSRAAYKYWKNGKPRVRNKGPKWERSKHHGHVKRSKMRKKL